jgi:hypothetical protein
MRGSRTRNMMFPREVSGVGEPDSSQTVTLEGTVKEFQWSNPHCWIQLLVTQPAAAAGERPVASEGDRFGTLNPTDGGTTRRASLSFNRVRRTHSDGRAAGVLSCAAPRLAGVCQRLHAASSAPRLQLPHPGAEQIPHLVVEKDVHGCCAARIGDAPAGI